MATVTAASNTAAKTAKQQKKQTKKKGKGTTAATDGKEAGGWYLEVEVLDTGTGGFSLGLCAATLQKPFKSLGNNPLSWVWHADGSILHNRGRSEPPASETADCSTRNNIHKRNVLTRALMTTLNAYQANDNDNGHDSSSSGEQNRSSAYGEGDVIGIYIAAAGGVTTLYKNGAVAQSFSHRFPNLLAGNYVLCCQPYMGGAGRLVFAGACKTPP